MSNELMTAATGSRALAKGLELLHALAASEAALPLRELAKVAGLGKASTQRLLQTLVATGFAAQDADNAYRWNHDRAWGGPTEKLAWQQRLREVATPILRELNADLAETVSLAVLIEDHIRVLDTWESPRHIRLSN
jgi:DNA-binding IclR family transcriptional regulator